MKKRLIYIIFIVIIISFAFADRKITRGPNIGEIYFLGNLPTATGIFHSTDFGETAVCVDSVFATMSPMSITADLTPGVVYYVTSGEGLYFSNNYGQHGSWELKCGGIHYNICSGVQEGFIFSSISSHSEDYGNTFIPHLMNGFFGSLMWTEIDYDPGIGYALIFTASVPDSIFLMITYNNFDDLILQNTINLDEETIGVITRGYESGELFASGGYNYHELRYSNDYGLTWELKNTFSCPNLPIHGKVGGKQPGEFYMFVQYVQQMHEIVHFYIYHSLDYGETFTVYHPFAYGPNPIYANFEAIPTEGPAPLTVQFTDISSGAYYWEWDFDNDGIIDSYEQNPVYTYQNPGTYLASLTIDTGSGLNEMTAWQEIYVTDGSAADTILIENIEFYINNYPNPFNPETTISFFTAKDAENAELVIYNLKGQKIKIIKIPNLSTQITHEIVWDGTDNDNKPVPSGIYLYKVNIQNSPVNKMILLN